VSYLIPHEWQLSPQVTYTDNESNLDINQFNRLQVFVSMRHDW
jgi:hypothetical protein